MVIAEQPARASVRREAAFQLFRKRHKLLIRDLNLALQSNDQSSRTGIPESRVLNCDAAHTASLPRMSLAA
jgi:hypothetical protein